LSSVIEALAPANHGDDLPASAAFTEIAEGDALRDRSFWFRVHEVATVSPHVGIGREHLGVSLTVIYEARRDGNHMDDITTTDRTQIAKALLDESNWGRPVSSINALSQGGSEVLPSTMKDNGDLVIVETNFEIEVST